MSAKIRIVPWDDLSQADHERLGLLVGSLEEFDAGIQLGSKALEGVTPRNHPAHRFFSNAVYSSLDSFYPSSGATGILPVLDSIGRKDLADIIRNVLATQVGDSTVGATLRGWRNKAISHPTFRVGHTLAAMKPAGLSEPENAETYMDHIGFLVHITRQLRTQLREMYPQAAHLEDMRYQADADDSP